MCTGHYRKYTNCKNEVVRMYTVIMQRVVTCVNDGNNAKGCYMCEQLTLLGLLHVHWTLLLQGSLLYQM